MAKKLLSVLGTGKYENCCYEYNGEECYTNYIQEALINFLCKDWSEEDRIIIFLTKESKEINFENNNDKTRRLKDRLLEKHISFDTKDIPNGKDETEIWEIYNTIFNTIDEGDEIYFDITHSFRSIPMLVMVVLNYAKVLKNIKLKGIYYGAFLAKENINNKEVAPIFNLSTFDELLEWSAAVNSFLRYGNSEHIKEISNQVLKEKLRERDLSAIKIKEFITELGNFTNCIYNCRGMLITNSKKASKKSIALAYKRMIEKLDGVINDNNDIIKPLTPLFQKIKSSTIDFQNSDNLNTGIAVTKWSIQNKLTQQAYTALEETIKTFVCVRFGMDDTDYNCREQIAAKALRIKARDIPEKDWQINIENQYKIKEIVGSIEHELACLSDKVNQMRNDINHFGFKNNPNDYDKLNEEINKLYESFLKQVELSKINNHLL